MKLDEFKSDPTAVFRVQYKQVYEWVKTGAITRKEFEDWIEKVIHWAMED